MKDLYKKIKNFFITHSKVPIKEKIFFVQQLSIMVKTGISLAVAIKTLRKQTGNKKMALILQEVEDNIQKGSLLSKTLEKYSKDFGQLFVNMIKSGEQSGRLEEVLKQLFIQMKKDHAIVSKVKGAMIYPSVVLIGMVGVGILMMVFVMPNLIGVFEELNAQLPVPTRVLIWMSKATQQYGIILFAVFIGLIVLFLRFKATKKGRRMIHKILLNIPVSSLIIKKVNIARFSRTFSALLKTDIPIIETFQITSRVLGNQIYSDSLDAAQEKIKKGMRVEEALRPYPKLYPPVILQMISVGEETGSLDDILEQTAQFYEEDVDQTMTNFPALIEPILILVLGVAVGTMAVAVIMPLYSLSQQI